MDYYHCVGVDWLEYPKNSLILLSLFGYAAVNLLFALGSLSGVGIVVGGMALFGYAWAYFAWLRRLSDSLGMWLLVYLLGAAMPMVLTFMMITK